MAAKLECPPLFAAHGCIPARRESVSVDQIHARNTTLYGKLQHRTRICCLRATAGSLASPSNNPTSTCRICAHMASICQPQSMESCRGIIASRIRFHESQFRQRANRKSLTPVPVAPVTKRHAAVERIQWFLTTFQWVYWRNLDPRKENAASPSWPPRGCSLRRRTMKLGAQPASFLGCGCGGTRMQSK